VPLYRDPVDRRRRYDVLRTALWTERTSGFDAHWRELAEVFMPRRIRFSVSDRNRGDKRNQRIIDSTGRFAARTLSAGMHAGLTSPARPWMKLTTPDPSLAQLGPVKLWLHEVSSRMLTIFATSNLYNVLPLVYLDMGIFGTAAMSIVQDSRDLFRCYSYPIGTFALGQDARGLATTFVRDYQLTVRQIVEEFCVQANGRDIDWTPASQRIKDLWERGDYEVPIDVTWVVKPNDYGDDRRFGSKYLPWASCSFETGSSDPKFLREAGFKTFPLMAPRWDITGEDTYGTDCPGMTVLGDNNQLQIMQKRKGQLLEKAVKPPMKGPTSLRTQKVSTLPGDITYIDVRDGMQSLSPVHEVRLEGFQHLNQDIGEVQYRIQRGFYEDLFLMLARSDDRLGADRPTAREVEERHEEKLLALGPVLERTNDELLDPIVDRVYQMMDDAGLVPPAPDVLHGVRLKVEYISILSQAQKLVGVVGQDRLLATAGSIVVQMPELSPVIRHKLDLNQIMDNYGDMLGVDPKIIVPTAQAQATLAKEQQQQQQAAEADQQQKLARAAKDASQTPLSGDTLLNRVAQSAAQNTVIPPQTPAPNVAAPGQVM
jgi:Bacteriophage head to tail connecting protein